MGQTVKNSQDFFCKKSHPHRISSLPLPWIPRSQRDPRETPWDLAPVGHATLTRWGSDSLEAFFQSAFRLQQNRDTATVVIKQQWWEIRGNFCIMASQSVQTKDSVYYVYNEPVWWFLPATWSPTLIFRSGNLQPPNISSGLMKFPCKNTLYNTIPKHLTPASELGMQI